MKPMFEGYTKEMYEDEGVIWVDPMLAKEIEDEDKQNECLKSPDYFIEEKFDGTRGTLHFFKDYTRCFSRRVSEKTGWLCENSDLVPHLRDIAIPELEGTIIDGEMFIPNRPFKDVSSTLNCKWEKAIERQEKLGKIVFHAFDILYYKGVKIEKMPLYRRKEFLKRVIDTINSEYVVMVQYYSCDSKIPVTIENLESFKKVLNSYPTLEKELSGFSESQTKFYLSPKAYYEFIVSTGGEGVIVKPKDGKYYHKRGWEYSKIKKFLTREVIVLGFTEPTKVYEGKFPKDRWSFWVDKNNRKVPIRDVLDVSAKELLSNGYTPVTRFYYFNLVGNIRYGVVISDEEIAKLPKKKKFNIETLNIEGESLKVLEIGDCAGFNDTVRDFLSHTYYNEKTGEEITIPAESLEDCQDIIRSMKKKDFVGTVIEVKANEIFKDTGKLRHPRFLRFRPDKAPSQCKWCDHVNQDIFYGNR